MRSGKVGGGDRIASTRSVPWRGVGVSLEGTTSARVALRRARLDWLVELRPWPAELASKRFDPDAPFMVVRGDQWSEERAGRGVLGEAPEERVPLQNEELISTAGELVDSGAAAFEAAGSLDRGRRIWALLRFTNEFEVAHGDRVRPFLLLASSHELGLSTIRTLWMRRICRNGLMMYTDCRVPALIAHTADAPERLVEARQGLAGVARASNGQAELFKKMAGRQIRPHELFAMLHESFALLYTRGPAGRRAAQDDELLAAHLFRYGRGNRLPGVAGSVWAALNGVTESVDHRVAGAAARLESIWFGKGNLVKQRAFRFAKLLVEQPSEPPREARRELPSLRQDIRGGA